MNTTKPELLPCPFCGGDPVYSGFTVDIGGGDFQHVFKVGCNCPVSPYVAVRGVCGYRNKKDTPNEEAKQQSIDTWNTRAPQWQDISTAPRDGTDILVYSAVTGECEVCWYDHPADAQNRWNWKTHDGLGYHDNKFSHWQPIQTPPGGE